MYFFPLMSYLTAVSIIKASLKYERYVFIVSEPIFPAISKSVCRSSVRLLDIRR